MRIVLSLIAPLVRAMLATVAMILLLAAVISTGPMLLAYAVSQKFMIRGIAMTGLKG